MFSVYSVLFRALYSLLLPFHYFDNLRKSLFQMIQANLKLSNLIFRNYSKHSFPVFVQFSKYFPIPAEIENKIRS